MHPLAPLSLLISAISCAAISTPGGYNLNLTLEGSGNDQYWILREENYPIFFNQGDLSTTNSFPPIEDIQCDHVNRAPVADCRGLIQAIAVDQGFIPKAPRHIQYKMCFMSWHTVTIGRIWDFAGTVEKIFRVCNYEDGVSGRHLGSGSAGDPVVCLSNRRKFC